MASGNQGPSPPPKPWEQAGGSSGPTPFKPPSEGKTSDVVEASGTAKPGEIVSNVQRNVPVNRNTLVRPVPPRPWEQNYGSNYGGYGTANNSGYSSGMYSSYGGFGGSYGGGLYGNNMYGGGYGGAYGGSGMYGGGMYNSGLGGPMGSYGMGMGMGMGMGGPYGNQDPNNPFGPQAPPSFWMSFLRVMHGVVDFFGRIAVLVDQNTQAFHMFMRAMLQLFDRSGLLYGELARFVLRLLGIRTRPRKNQQVGSNELSGLPGAPEQKYIEAPKEANGSWDRVWGDN
ncbi:hypothetical protein J5N97_020788 [Dioscorea zingiberensis]|uniref:Peroxin-13 n=1 Tax=Dioscorea zingiberensis TaxID=325984 RepID=A0A9D5HDR7_9LILI|nr:hypothetical protein J5N97_020788 [Dioscorea zingiberensis]